MDLDSYQTALEEVLTWLLSAEDTFQEQDDISEDEEDVKEQFATHEVGKSSVAHEGAMPATVPVPPRLCPDVCLPAFCPAGRSWLILGLVAFK